jgi:very-short-patch-repair endonuclease
MLICKFCQKECKNNNSFINHERLCPKNKDRKYVPGMLGKTSYKKGMTKHDLPEILKQSETTKSGYKTGRIQTPTGGNWTKERRQKQSEWKKQLHIDRPELHPNRLLAGNRKKMSYPEQVAYDFLKENNVVFVHNPRIGKFYPDFVIDNYIIEIDGARWHNIQKDQDRDKELNNLGYTVYRINATDNIHEKIIEVLKIRSIAQSD